MFKNKAPFEMTHDEVFSFMRRLWPEFSTKQVLCWYPCGFNTIRLIMGKDKREFCFTANTENKEWHLRLYAEWSKEEERDE